MKIAIVWYGKMWQIVEKHALERGYEITAIIDPNKNTHKEDLLGKDFDVIIEFCIPKVALENMEFYAKNNFKVIMATTGWYDDIEKIKQMFKKSEGAILWSGNFSIWVNLFWKMLEKACTYMNDFPEYDVFGSSFHHRMKVDSPSGTAIMTADIILDNIERKKMMITEDPTDRAIRDEELHFSSTSGGNIPGIHSVYFDSPYDTITLEHSARSRDGFAVGSLDCAKWLQGKKWYFEIQDFINNL